MERTNEHTIYLNYGGGGAGGAGGDGSPDLQSAMVVMVVLVLIDHQLVGWGFSRQGPPSQMDGSVAVTGGRNTWILLAEILCWWWIGGRC